MGENVRKLGPGRLVMATHNPGKVKEFNGLTSPFGINASSAGELGLNEPEETGKTFAENAAIKAQAAAMATNLPALADDSGLSVAALDGAPGIYSARWAGPEKDFRAAMDKVAQALKAANSEDYSAKFVCVLCLAWPDGHEEHFTGEVHGRLVFPPRGEKGFGYDPIFLPDGCDRTFGEMSADEKRALSHRARAFDELIAACLGAP